VFRNLECKRLHVDEVWGFVGAKAKNVDPHLRRPAKLAMLGCGSRPMPIRSLSPSWLVGGWDSDSAIVFMDDLAARPFNRVQLTSDGHKTYLEGVQGTLDRTLITPCL
jgi:hypothetical protein